MIKAIRIVRGLLDDIPTLEVEGVPIEDYIGDWPDDQRPGTCAGQDGQFKCTRHAEHEPPHIAGLGTPIDGLQQAGSVWWDA